MILIDVLNLIKKEQLHSIIKTPIFVAIQLKIIERGNKSSLFLFAITYFWKLFLNTNLIRHSKKGIVVERKIEKLLLEKFKEEEYSDCFIIEVMQNNKKLQIFIDSDSNIDFTKCRKISRYLEEYIDENNWLGEKYILEVSSPGIDRPLKFPRQYKKNIGRRLEVLTVEDEKVSGTLLETTEEGIVLEYKVRIKEGKKKRTEIVQQTIAFENIRKAIIKFSFSKK